MRSTRMLVGAVTIAFFVTALGLPAAAGPLKVAAAIPGSITDQAFNQQIYEGLMAAKERFGAEVAYSEKVVQADQVETMADYARRGYNVVIGSGGEFTDAAKRVARQFPKTLVVVMNGAPSPGIATINYHNQQFGYVLGYVAGKMSKTGKAGSVAGQKIKAYLEVMEGFEKGFKKARPGGQVFIIYTNDWDDVAKAKEAALTQIVQGADTLVPYLDNGIVGVVQAAKEKGVWAAGVITDLSENWPETNLLSTVLDFKEAIAATVEMAKDGKLERKDYRFGIGTKPGRLGNFNPAVPKELKAEVEKMVADMKAGKFQM